MKDLLLTAGKLLSGEALKLRSKRALVLSVTVSALALAVAGGSLWTTSKPLVKAKPPPPLPPDQGDVRFGIPLATRKEVFAELAKGEPGRRAEGKRAFAGEALAWSAEDHRGALERHQIAQMASRYHLSLTQIHLCLDEGIREHWLGPDGKPLDPHTVVLNPRRDYGF